MRCAAIARPKLSLIALGVVLATGLASPAARADTPNFWDGN